MFLEFMLSRVKNPEDYKDPLKKIKIKTVSRQLILSKNMGLHFQ